jgi:hypothetical protein
MAHTAYLIITPDPRHKQFIKEVCYETKTADPMSY